MIFTEAAKLKVLVCIFKNLYKIWCCTQSATNYNDQINVVEYKVDYLPLKSSGVGRP